jgi:hypothetical protein
MTGWLLGQRAPVRHATDGLACAWPLASPFPPPDIADIKAPFLGPNFFSSGIEK